MNLAEATLEAFEAHLHKTFRVSVGDELAFEGQLIEVAPMGETLGPQGRRPFSLVLRGPDTKEAVQSVYRLEHQDVGSFELFLVPIGPDDKGMKYEAVFT